MSFRKFHALVLLWAGVINAQTPLRLQHGNMWEYRYSDPMDPWPLRMAVTGDTVMPNSKDYFVLSGSLFTSPFLRVDSSKVYAYAVGDRNEFKLFDFLAQPGDTMAFLNGGANTILLQSSRFDSTIDRRFWNFILYQGPPGHWYEFFEWRIQDSLGLVSLRVEPGDSWYLTGARIAGDTIGILTTLKGDEEQLPEEAILMQNYPNPFNSSTTIKFSVPKSGFVTLKVFDLLGREIAMLVNEVMNPGVYERRFGGSGLASGVYLYRFSAGGLTQTRKLLLLR
jgi:hypothetical protein